MTRSALAPSPVGKLIKINAISRQKQKRPNMERNFLICFISFALITIATAGTLGYRLVHGDDDVERTDNLVNHTHNVISQTQRLAMNIEAMLAAQRGYLLTSDKQFLEKYQEYQKNVIKESTMITTLTNDNEEQRKRTQEIKEQIYEFTKKLDERAERFSKTKKTTGNHNRNR